MSLFSGGTAGGNAANGALVEFKAGRMEYDQETKEVTPLLEKGKVLVREDGGLIHFLWVNRASGNIALDLILFPFDARFKRAGGAADGARVFLLKFQSSKARHFFWLQEKEDTDDNALCAAVNAAINGETTVPAGGGDEAPAVATAAATATATTATADGGTQPAATGTGNSGSGGGGPAAMAVNPAIEAAIRQTAAETGLPEDEIRAMMLGGDTPTAAGGDAGAFGAPTGGNASPANASSGGGSGGGGVVSLAALQAALGNTPDPPVDLQTVLLGDNIVHIFEDEAVRDRLRDFLPAELQSDEELFRAVRTAQFKQAVAQLKSLLQSGMAQPFLYAFGLDPTVFGTNEFLEAVQKAADEAAGEAADDQGGSDDN